MSLIFLNAPMLWWLLLPAAVLVLAWHRRRGSVGDSRRQGASAGHADDAAAWARRHRPPAGAYWWPQALLVTGLVLLVAALARPAWRLEPEPATQSRRDVVFVLDVSNSMLANDRSPNRLEDARAAIEETVRRLPPQDRVGLVLFAGSSNILCPLTDDRAFFLDRLRAAGPEQVAHGGTRIGDALNKVADFVLEPDQGGFHDVILLTDGGDHGSEPLAAVKKLNDAAAGLVIVGLGDPVTGARIPDPYANPDAGPDQPAGYLEHDGMEVWVPMEPEALEAMVRSSDRGLWLAAGSGPYDLASTYLAFLDQAPRLQVEVPDVTRYRDEFQWFLLLGVLCLLAASRVPRAVARAARGEVPAGNDHGPVTSPRRHGWRQVTPAAMALTLPLWLTASQPGPVPGGAGVAIAGVGTAGSGDPDAELKARWDHGHRLLDDGRFAEAAEVWLESIDRAPERPVDAARQSRLFYNAGVAVARRADQATDGLAIDGLEDGSGEIELLREAAALFLAAARLDPDLAAAGDNLLWTRQRLQQRRQDERDPGDEDEREPGEDDGESQDGEREEGDAEGDPGELDDPTPDEDAEPGHELPADPSSTGITDLDHRGLPPPEVSPEEIVQEELRLQRERTRPRQPSPGVDRDW